MSDNTKRMYEGMFLFPQNAISDLQSASDHVMSLLQRADADVVSFKKWDDRRLAFEIKGNKRGVYFLTYFRCDPTRVADLERSCNLSELLLRSLVIRADHLNTEDIEAAEGRDSLADEIKLRTEQSASSTESGDGSSSVTIGSAPEAKEAPAEQAPAEQATATEEPPATEEKPQEN